MPENISLSITTRILNPIQFCQHFHCPLSSFIFPFLNFFPSMLSPHPPPKAAHTHTWSWVQHHPRNVPPAGPAEDDISKTTSRWPTAGGALTSSEGLSSELGLHFDTRRCSRASKMGMRTAAHGGTA